MKDRRPPPTWRRDDGHPRPDGTPPADAPQQNLLTVTRTVHCFAAGELLGVPGCSAIVDAGLTALWERHRDPERGGYVTAVPRGRTMAPSLVGAIRRSQAGPAVERVEHAGPR